MKVVQGKGLLKDPFFATGIGRRCFVSSLRVFVHNIKSWYTEFAGGCKKLLFLTLLNVFEKLALEVFYYCLISSENFLFVKGYHPLLKTLVFLFVLETWWSKKVEKFICNWVLLLFEITSSYNNQNLFFHQFINIQICNRTRLFQSKWWNLHCLLGFPGTWSTNTASTPIFCFFSKELIVFLAKTTARFFQPRNEPTIFGKQKINKSQNQRLPSLHRTPQRPKIPNWQPYLRFLLIYRFILLHSYRQMVFHRGLNGQFYCPKNDCQR